MSLSMDFSGAKSELAKFPRWMKWFFWLLIGVSSVIFAEVVSFSSPFPFFDGWGLLVVLPLYTLHILVFSRVLFSSKKVTLNALFLAGAVFGMYEAYITKVLWQPTWGEMTLVVGGIYLVQSALLVLFWHPWMAFAVPLLIVEGLFTSSHEVLDCLPAFLQRKLTGRMVSVTVIVFAVYCGMYQGLNSPSAGISLLSGLASGLVFGILVCIWRWLTRNRTYSLRLLLPDRREGIILSVLLLVTYLWQGLLVRPEALPRTIGPHLTIWGMYIVLGLLLYLNIKRSPALIAINSGDEAVGNRDSQTPLFSWKMALLFGAVFSFTSVLITWFKAVAVPVIWLSWGLGVGVGIWMITRSIIFSIRVLRGR